MKYILAEIIPKNIQASEGDPLIRQIRVVDITYRAELIKYIMQMWYDGDVILETFQDYLETDGSFLVEDLNIPKDTYLSGNGDGENNDLFEKIINNLSSYLKKEKYRTNIVESFLKVFNNDYRIDIATVQIFKYTESLYNTLIVRGAIDYDISKKEFEELMEGRDFIEYTLSDGSVLKLVITR